MYFLLNHLVLSSSIQSASCQYFPFRSAQQSARKYVIASTYIIGISRTVKFYQFDLTRPYFSGYTHCPFFFFFLVFEPFFFPLKLCNGKRTMLNDKWLTVNGSHVSSASIMLSTGSRIEIGGPRCKIFSHGTMSGARGAKGLVWYIFSYAKGEKLGTGEPWPPGPPWIRY